MYDLETILNGGEGKGVFTETWLVEEKMQKR